MTVCGIGELRGSLRFLSSARRLRKRRRVRCGGRKRGGHELGSDGLAQRGCAFFGPLLFFGGAGDSGKGDEMMRVRVRPAVMGRKIRGAVPEQMVFSGLADRPVSAREFHAAVLRLQRRLFPDGWRRGAR